MKLSLILGLVALAAAVLAALVWDSARPRQTTQRARAQPDGAQPPAAARPTPAWVEAVPGLGPDTTALTALNFSVPSAGPSAEDLLARVLATNRPWLAPAPAAVSYSLRETRRRHSPGSSRGDEPEKKIHGPFSAAVAPLPPTPSVVGAWMSDEAKEEVRNAAEQRLLRVGATLESPLHYLASGETAYDARMVGETTWKGTRVLGIDLVFADGIQCRIGMGPHRHGWNDGHAWYYGCRDARLLIEPGQAVPLLLIAYTMAGQVDPRRATTWELEPDFYEVDGGRAPRSLIWHSNDPSRGCERQRLEFQVAKGRWIFQRGEVRWDREPTVSFAASTNRPADTWTYELIDLRLDNIETNAVQGAPNPPAH